MEQNEILGYEPLLNELKQLIHQKQLHVLQTINSETINLYWEIGAEILGSNRTMVGGNP